MNLKTKTFSKTIFFPIIFFLLLMALPNMYAQQIRQLSQAEEERIQRYEEVARQYLLNGDTISALSYKNQITYIYWERGRPDRAIESFARTAVYYEKMKDYSNLYKIYSNIGLICLDIEDVEGSDRAFTRALEIQRLSGERIGITTALVDLAYVKSLRNFTSEAIDLLEEAQEIALNINHETVLPNIYKQLASNYTSIGNLKKGDEYRKKYNDIREYLARRTMRGEFQEREQESQLEILRSQAEARARELEIKVNQLIFQEKQDSISQVVRAQEDSLIQARQRDSLHKQNIVLLEQEGRLRETELERQKAEFERQEAVKNLQQLIIYAGAGFISLFIVLIIIVYNGYKTKQKINLRLEFKNAEIQHTNEKLEGALVKIEEQNYRITQSISYAKEIQKALFYPEESLKKYLPESFIFFKPVDMVSGDFYWFKEIATNNVPAKELQEHHHTQSPSHTISGNGSFLPIKGDKFVVSAVDCTGHGVPGAFMSMIGYNLLDSITTSGVTKANNILENLNNGVRKTLNQEEGNNQDGMDISLCVIDKNTKTVEFAGANNPIIYISDGEANIIKGDRMPIGGSQKVKERVYKSHKIKVEKPTWFYILTDGYTDQFGGEKGRKFLMKNFVDMLLSVYDKPMEEQQSLMGDVFEDWKKDESQIDDVLVIGFKLG